MDYPPHHNKHHHQREEEDYPPPQPNYPPSYQQENQYGYQPAPPVHHVSHQSPYEPNYAPPPPVQHGYGYEPPVKHVSHQSGYEPNYAPPPPVQHVSHQSGYEPNYAPPPPVQHVSHQSAYEPDPDEFRHETSHHHRPHLQSFFHHQSHSGGGSGALSDSKPTVRIYTKAELNYSLTIRDGKVVLVRSNPDDPFQHWIKDMKYSTKVKDEEGFPSFALVNKVTGQAIKHSIGATHPVQLIPYNPDYLDESVLWTESNDLGDSYRCIRMVNNIRLNMDAFNGDKNHGGVHDGTIAVLWEWKKGDNQRWKIAPY